MLWDVIASRLSQWTVCSNPYRSIPLKRKFTRILRTLSGTTWFILALLFCLCINSLTVRILAPVIYNLFTVLFNSSMEGSSRIANSYPCEQYTNQSTILCSLLLLSSFRVSSQNTIFKSYLGRLIFYSSLSVKFLHTLVIQLD